MDLSAALVDLLGLRTSKEVARAQVDALRLRIPVLYGIVCTNIVALAYTHYEVNEAWRVVWVPAVIVLVTGFRLVWWVRLRVETLNDAAVRKTLSSMVRLGSVAGFAILVWALTLTRGSSGEMWTGQVTGTGHAIFFVGITFISCIFLLMHYRLAAITVCLSIVFPFLAYLFSSYRVIETAIGLNMMLVTAAMLQVVISFSRHFERSVTDASDLLRLNAQNARLAGVDALTSLGNRRTFFSDLQQASDGPMPFAVIVVDLDGFKQVNDIYGHQAGDEVLMEIARRLRAVIPEHCSIARLGGDEFGCLVTGEHYAAARGVAARLIGACAEPVEAETFTAQVGASAGLCLSSRTGSGPSMSLYEQADHALFEAKRAGRGRVETFSGSHARSMRRESAIAHLLRQATLDQELSTVFQPIVSARDHEIRAFEALVRWHNPELGAIEPHEFIPIAERTDLIFTISLRVVRSALSQAQTWPAQVYLKVNLSVRDLMSSEQTRELVAEVRRSHVDPARVTFEITETIFAESLEQIRSNVDIVRAAGCKIAVDDFGVGYSSLNYIHTLAPDVIKIDRCFVAQVTTNDTTKRVVRTIVELARNVGARSVAEGVETEAQAEMLAELGCDELQGYHFSRPIAGDLSTRMVAARTTERLAARETIAAG